MTPELWQRVKRLFEAALACEPARRPSFVAEACRGDVELLRELESLLSAHDRSDRASDPLRLRGFEPGSRLGPYEVLSLVGAGGMGEVYMARDTRLDRLIAIKVISPLVADNPELLRRFEREARAVAALNHPHICTLHDIGSEDGVKFLVMEYLEGETLADRLSRAALPPDDVLRYAIQIGDALDAAHGRGVTHRDLKPANIMLTERGVKLLDFGLAKLATVHEVPVNHEPLTTLGRTPGTLQYMAPEQLAGISTDARTDIFSFGAVLYEMATRRKAFDGTSPLTPPALDRVVTRCLARNPDDRYPACGILLAELRSVANASVEPAPRLLAGRFGRRSVAAPIAALLVAVFAYALWPRDTPRESVAVLPFANDTADPELDYLSEGLADGLVNSLSRLEGLRVAPRTLVSRFAGDRVDIQAIGRSLGVQAMVTGRITKRDDAMTVAVELVDVEEMSQLWGTRYRTSSSGILDVGKIMTAELVERLRPGRDLRDPGELTRQYADNPEAYQAYLRGRHYIKMRTQEGFTKSIALFEQAIANDSSYALAYAGLADAFTMTGYFGVLPPAHAFPRAKAAALRALQLDERLAEAHSALAAVLLMYEWNFPGAEQQYQRALALDPVSALARSGYSMYLASQGRMAEAIAEATRAEQLDPVSPNNVTLTGWMFYFDRRYDRAIEQTRKALELNPNFAGAHQLLVEAVLASGLGSAEMRQILDAYDVAPAATGLQMAYVDAVSGDERSRRAFLASLSRRAGELQTQSFVMASMYAALGDPAAALAALEKAYTLRESPLLWLNVHPRFDGLRADPRFAALAQRIGLPR